MNTMPDVHSKWKPPSPQPPGVTLIKVWLGTLLRGENTQRVVYQKLANFCPIVSENIWTTATMLIIDIISVFHLLPARGPPTAICLIVFIVIISIFLFHVREDMSYNLVGYF